MKIPSLVKTPKHKRFQYKARYFDEVKDELRMRYGQSFDEDAKKDFEERISAVWSRNRREQKDVGRRRLVIFLVLVGVMVVFLLLAADPLAKLLLN